MAIAPDSVAEVPQHTTVGAYTVQRLGVAPSFSVTMVETVDDLWSATVTEMVPCGTPGEYAGVRVPMSDFSGLVGQPVLLADSTEVGVVASVAMAPSQLLFSTPVTTDYTGQTLHVQRLNAFGIPAHRAARQGVNRTLSLSSANADQFTRMQQLMGAAHVNAVLVVLAALGISKTPAEVQAAVASASDNLESILATQFEQLELERRAGTFVGLPMGGPL